MYYPPPVAANRIQQSLLAHLRIQNPNPTFCEIHESSTVLYCLSSPIPSSLIVYTDFILNAVLCALKDAYIHFYHLICMTSYADLSPPVVCKACMDGTERLGIASQYHIFTAQ